MKQYLVMKGEVLQNLLHCFSTPEGYKEFTTDLALMLDEIVRINRQTNQNPDYDLNTLTLLAAKQFFHVAFFCQKNMDVIHDMVRQLDYKILDQEEKDSLDDTVGEYFDFDKFRNS